MFRLHFWNLLRIVLLLLLLILPGCYQNNESDFLEDQQKLLNQRERQHLVGFNQALLRDLDIHFKLIISDHELVDIDREAARIFGDLGKKTGGAKGLLFLVDPIGKQVRIEVGYDLEGVFPDIFVGYIERRQMIPFLSAGKVAAGIEAATELFITRLEKDKEGESFSAEQELPDLAYFSGGGGAKIKADIGTGPVHKEKSEYRELFQPQDTPEATLQHYLKVLHLHIKDPELPLFTPATRTFFANWVVTDAQQENEYRSLQEAQPHETFTSGTFGIIRYPISARAHSPFFFQHGENGWMLDFATMSRVLQMNHKNMWRMRTTDHPYMFGFADWTFDKNGFPVSTR
ncbi:TPM domain-containing protein [Desulfopila sp. IMCC35008]|uniref:TPM domain-containing protein n=1 Tax=Desulfopila sp. IMCC35008 TaxID=2653858 RepID=UPI0013D55030|nr:TPM domain-containing protein [Desulfopila sp. IMCC35008]